MCIGYARLCLKEREERYRLQREGVPKHGIARLWRRSDRALLDEFKRCAGDALAYLPDRAQAHADAQASRRRESPDSLRAAQLAHLHAPRKLDYAPEQIAGRLQLKNSPLYCCHATLSTMAYAPDGCALDLPALRPRRQKKRTPRRTHPPKLGGLVGAVSIPQRPQPSNDRTRFGPWEGDGVIFECMPRPHVTTRLERGSRFVCRRSNADRTTAVVMPAIIQGLSGLPPMARLAIPFDRGTANASHRTLHTAMAMQTFFCAPHAPWQQGANENCNGRLRRCRPKGKIPRELSQESLDQLALKMNNTPRQCRGYPTPAEGFQQLAFPQQLHKNCVRN